jgi:hypothetical protein
LAAWTLLLSGVVSVKAWTVISRPWWFPAVVILLTMGWIVADTYQGVKVGTMPLEQTLVGKSSCEASDTGNANRLRTLLVLPKKGLVRALRPTGYLRL